MDLMGVTEIAQLLGVSRQRADQLSRAVGFPAPIDEISAGRIWQRKDIERWARRSGRLQADATPPSAAG